MNGKDLIIALLWFILGWVLIGLGIGVVIMIGFGVYCLFSLFPVFAHNALIWLIIISIIGLVFSVTADYLDKGGF